MSFKGSMEAIKKVEKETAMRDRGGFAFLVDGADRCIAFFGEKEMVERAIFTIVTDMTNGMSVVETNGRVTDGITAIETAIMEKFLPDMRRTRKLNGERPLLIRDECSIKDNFEAVAEFITKNVEPVQDQDFFLFSMAHGSKVISSGIHLVCNKQLLNRLKKGNQGVIEQIADKVIRALLNLIANYLEMYTPCTKTYITGFFMRLRAGKMCIKTENIDMVRMRGALYPPVIGLIQ